MFKICKKRIIAMGLAVSMVCATVVVNKDMMEVEANNYGYGEEVSFEANGIGWKATLAVTSSDEPYLKFLRPADKSALDGKKVVVPSGYIYNGEKYVSSGIDEKAFANSGVVSVEFPEDVTFINVGAFANCSKLVEVSLCNPASIGEGAFENCIKIEKISCSKVYPSAFAGCKSLKEVRFYKRGYGDTIEIAQNAFKDCTSLETINFYEGNESTQVKIGKNAFVHTKIKELKFDYDITLEEAAFESCTNLETVTFGKDVTFSASTEGKSAFEACTGLKKMVFQKSVKGYQGGMSNLEEIVFEGETGIAGNLRNLPNLKKVLFTAYNPIIVLTDSTDSSQKFDIIGYKDEDGKNIAGRDSVYRWAESIGKKDCFKNAVFHVVTEYAGTQVVDTKPNPSNVLVNAFYYDATTTPVKLKAAISDTDLSGYQLIMNDKVTLGTNYYTVKYFGTAYPGSFVGVAKRVEKLVATTKAEGDIVLEKDKGQALQDGMITIKEGQAVTNTMFDVMATYNDGSRATITDYKFGAYSTKLEEKEVSKVIEIPITYTETVEEAKGKVENTVKTSIKVKVEKRSIVQVEPKYVGEVYIGHEIDLSQLTVTVFYNDGTSENVKDITVNHKVIEKIGENEIAILYEGKEYTVKVNGIQKVCTSVEVQAVTASVIEGKVIDKSFFKVIKKYSDQSIEEITNPDIVMQAGKAVVLGNNVYVVTYEGKNYEVIIEGTENGIVAITAKYIGSPLRIGDTIKVSDIQVIAHFKDGKTAIISDGYFLLGTWKVDSITENKKSITYCGMKTELEIQVQNSEGPSKTQEPAIELSKVAKISLVKSTYFASKGKVVKPKVVVKCKGKELVMGQDYALTYKNNKSYGKAKVIITGKGSYTGTITKSFTILPLKVVITSTKALKYKNNKVMKLVWKKQKGVSGYVIYAAAKKNGKYKEITCKDGNVGFATFTAFHKKVYVKMRAYVVINGKTKYGKYSAVKLIKLK